MVNLVPVNKDAIRNELLASKTVLAAVRRDQGLFLISAVYRGLVKATIDFHDSLGEAVTSRLQGFQLRRLRHGQGSFVLESASLVEFAYHADRLEYRLNDAGQPVDLQFRPAMAAELPATDWDSKLRDVGEEDGGYKVKVFYASDRHAAKQDERAPSQFWFHFVDYYLPGKSYGLLVPLFGIALLWVSV